MSETVYSVQIQCSEWPTRDDLQEFLRDGQSRQKIREFLTQEFDTLISMKVGDIDLFSDYPDAFILPVHAFVRELSQGIKTLDLTPQVTIPIYLQQYAIEEGDPAHRLILVREGEHVRLRFVWGGKVATPQHLRFDSLLLHYQDFRQTVLDFMDTYIRKVMMLLAAHADWKGEEIAVLFESF